MTWMEKLDWTAPEGWINPTLFPVFKVGTDNDTAYVTLLITAVTVVEGVGGVGHLYSQQWKIDRSTGIWSPDPGPEESEIVEVDEIVAGAFITSVERSATGGHLIRFGTSGGA